MRGRQPNDDELDALTAYLKTLDFVPPATVNRDSAVRGEAIFRSKRCNTCHPAPNFTSNDVYQVGLESHDDAYKGFNPSSLRGVVRRAPFLHDGRARTLEEVLKVHHRPSQLSGESDLTARELADLVEYLKSL
jgi:cytochrome c peroxidase